MIFYIRLFRPLEFLWNTEGGWTVQKGTRKPETVSTIRYAHRIRCSHAKSTFIIFHFTKGVWKDWTLFFPRHLLKKRSEISPRELCKWKIINGLLVDMVSGFRVFVWQSNRTSIIIKVDSDFFSHSKIINYNNYYSSLLFFLQSSFLLL